TRESGDLEAGSERKSRRRGGIVLRDPPDRYPPAVGELADAIEVRPRHLTRRTGRLEKAIKTLSARRLRRPARLVPQRLCRERVSGLRGHGRIIRRLAADSSLAGTER